MNRIALFPLALALVACGSSESPGSSVTTTGAATSSGTGGAGGEGSGGAGGSGGSDTTLLDAVEADLQGDFDNSAQHATSGGKLVERQVCAVPGRAENASVLWLYVEQLDDTSGKRDTYSTRVDEIRLVNGTPVTRIYKLAPGHPLAIDPYKFNGARDGCSKPELLKAITDADLLYRDGCDVTFSPSGSGFDAATADNTCAVPGGFINTALVVSADGLTSTDTFYDAASKKSLALSSFEFQRVKPSP